MKQIISIFIILVSVLTACTSDLETVVSSRSLGVEATTQTRANASLKYQISDFTKKCSLSGSDLTEFNSILKLMQDDYATGSFYVPLFKRDLANGYKIVDISRSSSTINQGGYNPTTKKITFNETADISNVFPEEFIHFNQDNYYPGGTSQYVTKGKPNIEMEAKIIEDCADLYGTAAAYYGAGPTYGDTYRNWIWDLVYNNSDNNKYFPSMNYVLTYKINNIGYRDFIEDLKKKSASYNYESINSLNPILIDFIYKNKKGAK